MAYQNVVTPRFYIDSGLYQYTIGVWTPEDDWRSFIQLNPTARGYKPSNDIIVPRISPIRYIAFLANDWGNYYPSFQPHTEGLIGIDDFEEIINMSGYEGADESDGFCMGIFSDRPDATGMKGVVSDSDSKLGAISIGNYYDMPISPDLELKMSIEMGGVKNIQTKGGGTLSNAMYTKPADWGTTHTYSPTGVQGAWQADAVPNYRNGRRVWELSFSYLSDESIMPVNASTSIIENTNILAGEDFFSVVWNQTLGNRLSFIFQPDNTNNNPDQFAICKFVGDKLQYNQVAHNVYNITLKIEEVW